MDTVHRRICADVAWDADLERLSRAHHSIAGCDGHNVHGGLLVQRALAHLHGDDLAGHGGEARNHAGSHAVVLDGVEE